jgi:ABC-2 type transport system ATP-binding protein
MKQRLGIAQALLHDPELIILDEPTTGLDPQGMKEIRDLILYLSKTKNKTIFLSSHILREVEIIATRMIIISKGTTQVEGTVDELLNVDKMSVSLEVDRIEDAVAEIKNSKWAEVYKTNVKNEMQFDMLKSDVAELNRYLNDRGFMVGSVVPVRSLEDFFLKITEGGQK